MYLKNQLARNLTPPGSHACSLSGTFPLLDPDDEITNPVNHNAVMVQKVIHIMDNLSEDDKQLFLIFAEAYDMVTHKNKQALVNVAVTMAKL